MKIPRLLRSRSNCLVDVISKVYFGAAVGPTDGTVQARCYTSRLYQALGAVADVLKLLPFDETGSRGRELRMGTFQANSQIISWY